jgi:hypothetical protein
VQGAIPMQMRLALRVYDAARVATTILGINVNDLDRCSYVCVTSSPIRRLEVGR